MLQSHLQQGGRVSPTSEIETLIVKNVKKPRFFAEICSKIANNMLIWLLENYISEMEQ